MTTLLQGVATGAICLALASLAACSTDSAADRCAELEAWYTDNPGDSNVDIANDYYRSCGDLPPPVLSGELEAEQIY